PQSLSIRAENENADPYIYLFDGAGTLIAENDDYDSLNSRIDVIDPLPAGTYCVGMRALFDPELPVTLRIQPYDAAAEQAERIAAGDAAPPLDGSWPLIDMGLLPPVTVRDLPVQGRRAQWLSFELGAPTVLVIDAMQVGDADPVIILFDAAGTEVAFSDDSNGTLDSQILTRLEAGRYLLAVRHYSDSYSGAIRVATERFVRATE
ncbi:DVUA0089 family protein, partial [Roseicyclus sp.]|uniref:DVUA0089 family protein n=1 Tax=Roseicyclus sp. TaxID=1914329 RepID=UPI003FA01597